MKYKVYATETVIYDQIYFVEAESEAAAYHMVQDCQANAYSEDLAESIVTALTVEPVTEDLDVKFWMPLDKIDGE